MFHTSISWGCHAPLKQLWLIITLKRCSVRTHTPIQPAYTPSPPHILINPIPIHSLTLMKTLYTPYTHTPPPHPIPYKPYPHPLSNTYENPIHPLPTPPIPPYTPLRHRLLTLMIHHHINSLFRSAQVNRKVQPTSNVVDHQISRIFGSHF